MRNADLIKAYKQVYNENVGVPVIIQMDMPMDIEADTREETSSIQDTLKLIQHYAEELIDVVTPEDESNSEVGSHLSQALNFLEYLHNKLVVERGGDQDSQEDCETYDSSNEREF